MFLFATSLLVSLLKQAWTSSSSSIASSLLPVKRLEDGRLDWESQHFAFDVNVRNARLDRAVNYDLRNPNRSRKTNLTHRNPGVEQESFLSKTALAAHSTRRSKKRGGQEHVTRSTIAKVRQALPSDLRKCNSRCKGKDLEEREVGESTKRRALSELPTFERRGGE